MFLFPKFIAKLNSVKYGSFSFSRSFSCLFCFCFVANGQTRCNFESGSVVSNGLGSRGFLCFFPPLPLLWDPTSKESVCRVDKTFSLFFLYDKNASETLLPDPKAVFLTGVSLLIRNLGKWKRKPTEGVINFE